MKKQLTFLLMFVLTLSMITFISAIPPEPMAFYGNINYVNGTAIPDGYYLTAKINNVVSGECEIINGVYGKGTDTCIVVTHSTSTNLKVEFFIGTYKIGESTFQNKEIVNLDFTVVALPLDIPPLSDGVCELRECSYNMLDCDNSVTKMCVGNEVCDSAIGETCENTPSDCTCATPDTGGSGGSSGGGGGGSSSATTSNVIKLSPTNTSSNPNPSTTATNNKETTDKETEKTSGIFGITGLAIGDFVKSSTGKGIIIFIVLVAVLIVLFVLSKKKLKDKSSKSDKMFKPNKRNGRKSKAKNIKVVKLSEMKKKSS